MWYGKNIVVYRHGKLLYNSLTRQTLLHLCKYLHGNQRKLLVPFKIGLTELQKAILMSLLKLLELGFGGKNTRIT